MATDPMTMLALIQAQKQLLRNPITSDITVKCGDRVWRCQSSILRQRCAFFNAALAGNFSESTSKVIDMSEDPPDAVDAILIYLYTLQPLEPGHLVSQYPTTKNIVSAVFTLADKYSLKTLLGYMQFSLRLQAYGIADQQFLQAHQIDQFDAIDNTFELEMEAALPIKEAMMNSLVKEACKNPTFVEEPRIKALLAANEFFRVKFILGIAKEAARLKDRSLASQLSEEHKA